jgi:hypothetical protein
MAKFQCKQWTLEVEADESGNATKYQIVNLAPDGTMQYYRVVSGQYGQPLIEQEPSLGLTVPSAVSYTDSKGNPTANPTQKVVGLICRDASGAVVQRLSLTNAKNKNIPFKFNDDGMLELGGEVYHLRSLVSPDKNRLIGLVGFFSPTKSDAVSVLELEDLVP